VDAASFRRSEAGAQTVGTIVALQSLKRYFMEDPRAWLEIPTLPFVGDNDNFGLPH
jgi:hypothetical protein